MKVIGYVRVSSVVQRDKGNSIKMQYGKIRDYCKLNDYDLIEVYEDNGVSGMGIDKRDGYKEMLNYILMNKIDGIIVYSLSRLGRKLKDVIGFMEVLKENGIKFFSIKEGLNNNDNVGELIMNILGSINEFEVNVIRERIKDVKRSKKEKGEVYGRLMYGFDNVDGKLIENKFERNVVKRIKNLRSRGWSWRRICIKLNDDGISSKEGNIWYDGSLYNMMRCYSV